jgi:hypothetical protein
MTSIEFLGGPVDGKVETTTRALPEFWYIPKGRARSFQKPREPQQVPADLASASYTYRLVKATEHRAYYQYVPEVG